MRGRSAFGGWGVGVKLAAARTVGLIAALSVAPGCRPRQSPDGPEEAAAPVTSPTPVRRGEVAVAVAPATSPVQLLPDTTVALFSMAGIRSLLAVVDVEALIDKYHGQYDQMGQLSVQLTGINLLDPNQWREVGVDPDGPMGAAILDLDSQSFVGFISLSNPDKFRGFLDKMSRASLQPVIEDRGVVLKTAVDSGAAVVLRDGFALFLNTNHPQRAPYDYARSLATIDPARGLTGTPRYQRATRSGAPPRPLNAYVDVWAIVQGEHAAWEARQGPGEPSWAEQELQRLATAGAPEEEQKAMRMQVAREQDEQRRARDRHMREFALLGRWLGGVEPIVLEFTASRTGVVGEIRAKMPEAAPLRAVLRNAPMPSPVFAALGERPLVMLGGEVDVAAAFASFEEFVRADGEEPEAVYRELREDTGVDLKTEAAPLLTGAGGLAMTAGAALLRGDWKADYKDIGFALALGVKDVAAAQALVSKVAQRMRVKVGKDAKTGAFTLAMPGYRTVYAGVTAGQIVVTTDLGVIRRMSTETATPAKGLDPAVVPVVTARDVTMVGLFDPLLPVFLGGSRGSVNELWLGDVHDVFPDVKPAQIDRVPYSRAYKAKERALRAMEAKINKQEEVNARRQWQLSQALAGCVGVTAVHLREQPDGLELKGGQYFGKGGLDRAIELGAEYFQVRSGEQNWELYGQRAALAEELRRIRINDVAIALHLPVPLQ